MADKKFYLTTPIFYPNAKLHLGHAYTTTLSDILARYHRLMGEKTYFLTGSDENTQKVVQAARAAGVEVKPFLDGIVGNFKELFKKLNISYDQFIRTSDEGTHWPGAVALWQKLDAAGDLYKKEYEGLYCVGHEAFITEKDLVDGKCPEHGTTPEHIKEENYFFKLSKYTAAIKQKIESGELQIIPETRRHEILSLLEQGLQDVSFSRPKTPTSVGIPVPGDAAQVMYVWCDALTNYITALGYGQDETLYKEFWPADVHVIGKDILRFHAAIWPATLLSAGISLPKTILVHGFITSGGKKMSKTLGNVIDPEELLTEYGTDAVRYYLARYISPFEDGDLTREHFKEVYNADLANGLGNLAKRILVMAKNVGITFNPKKRDWSDPIEMKEKSSDNIHKAYFEALNNFQINRAIEMLWMHFSWMDKSIASSRPFKLIKTNPDEAKKDISTLLEDLYNGAMLLKPFLPSTAERILAMINGTESIENSLFPRKD